VKSFLAKRITRKREETQRKRTKGHGASFGHRRRKQKIASRFDLNNTRADNWESWLLLLPVRKKKN